MPDEVADLGYLAFVIMTAGLGASAVNNIKRWRVGPTFF